MRDDAMTVKYDRGKMKKMKKKKNENVREVLKMTRAGVDPRLVTE
jgi:hypothetical protein